MRGLKDRTVLVTGGANGIGAAIARRLAQEGCAVGILDLDAASGETLVGEIKAAGGEGWFCALDRAGAKAVRDARAHGLVFGVWTVNRARDMRALAGLGVDAICTDRPDRLKALTQHSA